MEKKEYKPYKVPIDVLECPITKRKVWLRDFWDGGEAMEITREDPMFVCPVCQGGGHVTVLENGYGNMIVQPEHEEACPAKCTNGCLNAIYADVWYDADDLDMDDGEVLATTGDYVESLIWPQGDEDAIEGYTE
jgi:hypothetical protein